MDLNRVTTFRRPQSRADLVLAPGEIFLGGGSWLFSEPQPQTAGLVDLTALRWEPIERIDDGLRLAATCTLAQLAALPDDGWADSVLGGGSGQPWKRRAGAVLLIGLGAAQLGSARLSGRRGC